MTNSRAALYRFYGEDNVLLYVGITEHLGVRWNNHSKKKPWWPEVQRQTAEWYATRAEAAAAEVIAVQTEHPRHNVAHTIEVFSPEETEKRERRLAIVDASNRQYAASMKELDATREKLFDECADAVREGHTPDELAQVTAFTAVTIRKALRERDVAPLRSGPKSRKTTPPE